MLHTKTFARSFALVCTLTASLASAQPAAHPATSTAISSADSSAADEPGALGHSELASALRKGGYVIYFRHTSTDFSKTDSGMKNYTDCANQRLLSEAGRQSAREIGQRIEALKLPAGEVLASPMCRTMDTARQMFRSVTPNNAMREGESGDYPGLKALLAGPVAPGGNRWLVGHGIPFRAVAGAPHLAEGEAAVLKPEGTRWRVLARLQPQDWAALK